MPRNGHTLHRPVLYRSDNFGHVLLNSHPARDSYIFPFHNFHIQLSFELLNKNSWNWNQKFANISPVKIDPNIYGLFKWLYSILRINYNYRRSFRSKIDWKMKKKRNTKKNSRPSSFFPQNLSPVLSCSKIGRPSCFSPVLLYGGVSQFFKTTRQFIQNFDQSFSQNLNHFFIINFQVGVEPIFWAKAFFATFGRK